MEQHCLGHGKSGKVEHLSRRRDWKRGLVERVMHRKLDGKGESHEKIVVTSILKDDFCQKEMHPNTETRQRTNRSAWVEARGTLCFYEMGSRELPPFSETTCGELGKAYRQEPRLGLENWKQNRRR